jgi:quercetin dioxygenase-like cupin family protein
MKLHEWQGMEHERLSDTISRKVLHGDQITVAHLHLNKGAIVPRHTHVNEQISFIEKGRLKFIFDDREIIVAAGQALQIPGHEPHAAEALDDVVATDVFTPTREDWIRGDDAYLRR